MGGARSRSRSGIRRRAAGLGGSSRHGGGGGPGCLRRYVDVFRPVDVIGQDNDALNDRPKFLLLHLRCYLIVGGHPGGPEWSAANIVTPVALVQETPAPTEQAIQSPAPQARSVWVGSFVTLGFRTSRLVVMAQPTRIGRQRNDRKTNNHSQAKERAILRGIGYLPGGQLSRSESATIPEPTGLATSALLLGFHPPEPLGRRLLVARGNLGQHRIQGSEQFWRKHRRRPSIRPQR